MKVKIYPIKLENKTLLNLLFEFIFQFSLFPISIVIVPIPFVSIGMGTFVP